MQYEINEIKNTILCGNVLDELRKFPDDCIDCIITSPPYFGLRDYGEDTKVIWDGNENCEHEWQPRTYTIGNKAGNKDKSLWFDGKPRNNIRESNKARTQTNNFCNKCGAFYGQLGLEPTLDLYLDHLLQITAELKRVLKKTGVFFLNHGDCYGGSGMGTWKNPPEKINSKEIYHIPYSSNVPTRKNRDFAKCLMLQNWRLILKMIDEQGWILRNSLVWYKPNGIPSSVKDRFANKYEPVFMLVKNKKYFFDLDAVRIPAKTNENRPYGAVREREFGYNTLYPEVRNKFNYRVRDAEKKSEQCPQFKATKEEIERYKKRKTSIPEDQAESFGSPRARYWREKKSLEERMEDTSNKDTKSSPAYNMKKNLSEIRLGLKPDYQGMRKNPGDVFSIPTQPCPKEYRGKHFAMFPEKLVEPMILAGCPAQICKKCGKARERISKYVGDKRNIEWHPEKYGDDDEKGKRLGRMQPKKSVYCQSQTIGWTKCQCENPEYEAGIVLDPFCGLATTCVVAKRLNINYIGIEISKEYAKLAEKRIKDTPAPLL